MDIFVYKARRLLVCSCDGHEILRSPIMLGSGANDGPKLREGDGRTPEGEYVISSINAESRFFRSLGISYPSPADAVRGLNEGVIGRSDYERICAQPDRPPWDTPMGGYIMIHGQRTPPAEGDWTAGCIAVENDIMERIFALSGKGDHVLIFP